MDGRNNGRTHKSIIVHTPEVDLSRPVDIFVGHAIWFEAQHFEQVFMFAQLRLRSACACACRVFTWYSLGSLGATASSGGQHRLWSACAGWSESLLGQQSFRHCCIPALSTKPWHYLLEVVQSKTLHFSPKQHFSHVIVLCCLLSTYIADVITNWFLLPIACGAEAINCPTAEHFCK